MEGEGVFGLVEYVEVYAGGAALDEVFDLLVGPLDADVFLLCGVGLFELRF